MGVIDGLAAQVGGAVAGQAGQQIGYAIGQATGYNDSIRDDQLEQQKKLQEQQQISNFKSMDKAQELNKDMFGYTFDIQSRYDSAAQQKKRLIEAGLNPALMYSNGNAGFAGGSTGNASATQVQGGNASDEVSRKQNDMQNNIMGIQLAKLQSEIDVNKSVAEVNRASAGLSTAKTTTEDEQRNMVIEKLKQEGKSTWLENLRKEWTNEMPRNAGNTSNNYRNEEYGQTSISSHAMFNEGITSSIMATLANTGNAEASAVLSNKRAEGYMTELLNATVQADAAKMNAITKRMEVEFSTGENINWKSFEGLAKTILMMLRR